MSMKIVNPHHEHECLKQYLSYTVKNDVLKCQTRSKRPQIFPGCAPMLSDYDEKKSPKF